MSFNQSRFDKSESNSRHQKPGRSTSFNQQRGSPGTHSKTGGAGGSAPSPSITSSRRPNNAQGGQPRAGILPVNSSDSSTNTARGVSNGAHVQPQSRGASDAPVTSTAAKSTESQPVQRSTRAVPKAPTYHSTPMSSDASPQPTTPSKTGDSSKEFAFQFGSISPGFMNGMQIPARTSSAPPNLDEQKRDQARRDAYRPVPHLPAPSAPKPQLPKKDASMVDQPHTGEAHMVPKPKKEILPSPPPPQMQKPSVHSMPGISMPIPFHQPQVSVPFGGLNQQIKSQGMTTSSLPMPMFVQGYQPHPMQNPGIVHQGQGMGFTTQLGGQIPPQMVNLGINLTPQYPQQQGGKFSVATTASPTRKPAVRITDPKTHEELRFDNNKRTEAYTETLPSGSMSHPNIPPQSQPPPAYTSHQVNYLPNSYNPNPLYFPNPNSISLASGQIAPNSQVQRFNFPVHQSIQNVSLMNSPALGSHPVNKACSSAHGIAEPNLDHAHDSAHNVTPSATVHVTVRPPTSSVGEKPANSLPTSSHWVGKDGSHKLPRSSGEGTLSSAPRDPSNSLEKLLSNSKPGSESKSLPVANKQSVEASSGEGTLSSAPRDPGNSLEKLPLNAKPGSGTLVSKSLPVANKQSVETSAAPSQPEVSKPVAETEGRRRETLARSDSFEDHHKKPGKKGPAHQVVEQSTSSLNLHVQENAEPKTTLIPVIVEGESERVTELLSSVSAVTSDVPESKGTDSGSTIGSSSETSTAGIADETSASTLCNIKDEPVRIDIQGEDRLTEDLKSSETVSELLSSNSGATSEQTNLESALKSTAISSEVPTLEPAQEGLNDSVNCQAEVDREADKLDASTSTSLLSREEDISQGIKALTLDSSSSRSDSIGSTEVALTESGISDLQPTDVQNSELLKGKDQVDVTENVGVGRGPTPVASSKDKSVVEMNKAKGAAAKGKKKIKKILQRADAAGTTSDLYVAYKGPEEKIETMTSSVGSEETSASVDPEEVPAESLKDDVAEFEKDASRDEPDDWEDAADMSSPKLETSHGEQDNGENGYGSKKYSRDFLLKFMEQFTALPKSFEITHETEALMNRNDMASRIPDYDSTRTAGRPSSGGSRFDRHRSGMLEDDRWNKLPGPFAPGRDPHLDLAYLTSAGASAGFQLGQGANFGVLRNPQAQGHIQYVGGILAGPMQSLVSRGGLQRNNSDADRWQRATNFVQKGLIPSPQTPAIHKAEKRYEVGKVTDEEQAKQRQLKGILNKLTPQNFDKLFEQVKAVNIGSVTTLNGVISQIFDKALMEPTFCEMYADFCSHLAGELPDFVEDNGNINFRRLLLNKCQEEFERGEREEEEANKIEEEGEVKQSDEEREEKRIKARRRMLGNIRLIGELYKKKMLTAKIMHGCIKKLLGQYKNPEEENIEALCKLIGTIGEMIDQAQAKEHMDAYFEMMAQMSNNKKLSSRIRFMLKDSIDLRRNKWQQRRKIEGPKKIDEVHRDAAQERQAQTSRLARGPGINSSARRGSTMDFVPRGSSSSMLSSPSAQMGGFHGFPSQNRFGSQDARQEVRQSYEARTLSVPLPQRSSDETITLGPQGGLARGMSIRGPQSAQASSLADIHPSPGDSRRTTTALNGYSSVSERAAYNSREGLIPRSTPDRFSGTAAFDQSNAQGGMSFGNREVRNSNRNLWTPQGQVPSLTPSVPSELMSEDRLHDMSIGNIKEFYSARDEKEVARCINDMNSPGFYPAMISVWITDSFERKDMERDLLAELLVNLSKSHDVTLNQTQLIKGFESVLATLEDAVNDAPKAPEFLGRMLAKIILEDVISLKEIGQLIQRGGDEPGCLLQVGLAADLLGNILEAIRSQKGDLFLNEIRTSSNLRIETFRPADPRRSRILEKFM